MDWPSVKSFRQSRPRWCLLLSDGPDHTFLGACCIRGGDLPPDRDVRVSLALRDRRRSPAVIVLLGRDPQGCLGGLSPILSVVSDDS